MDIFKYEIKLSRQLEDREILEIRNEDLDILSKISSSIFEKFVRCPRNKKVVFVLDFSDIRLIEDYAVNIFIGIYSAIAFPVLNRICVLKNLQESPKYVFKAEFEKAQLLSVLIDEKENKTELLGRIMGFPAFYECWEILRDAGRWMRAEDVRKELEKKKGKKIKVGVIETRLNRLFYEVALLRKGNPPRLEYLVPTVQFIESLSFLP